MAKSGNQRGNGKGAKQPNARTSVAAKASNSLDSGAMTPGQRITWICLHLLVFMVPVAMSNWTWLGFNLPMTYDQFDIIKVFLQRALTLVALGAWSWDILRNGGRIRRTKIDYLILALLGWILLTSLTSIHPPTAFFGKYRRFEGFISFVNYAVMFFLAVQVVDRASRIRSLARTLFFGGVIVSTYGLMQYVGVDPITWGNLPFEAQMAFSTYGNPDLLGGYIIFPLVISLGLALSENDVRWRIVYWGGFLLTAACWVVAFVRGAWIGGVVGIVFLVVVAFRHRAKVSTVDYSFMGAVTAVGTYLVYRSLSSTSSVTNVAKRLASITKFDEGSAKTRFEIWQAAINAIKARPITGFGADTFRLVFPKYKPIEYVADAGYLSVADNVHNYPLQATSALGIPGFLLLYGTFAAAAWFSAPLVFKKHEGTDRLVLASFWAAAAGYLAHLMFGLSVTGSSFLLWIAMAVVLSPIARTVKVEAPSWGVPVAIVCIALVVLLSVGNVVYVAADNAYLTARVVVRGAERITKAEEAIRLNPYNDMYRAELGLAYVDNVVSYLQQTSTLDAQAAQPYLQAARTDFLNAEEALLSAIDFVPSEYDNYVFLANLYNLGADYFDPAYGDKAIGIARRGIEVEPYGPAVRFQLARALLRAGEYDEARDEATYATEMDPRYFEARLMLGEINLKAGDLQAAKEAYEAAYALNPEYSGLAEQIESIDASLAAQSD